ncbi:formyltransferase family protein, partial [Staphylococcus aureus]|nr:formyltransferase family protein [Staphylococcus aureus]
IDAPGLAIAEAAGVATAALDHRGHGGRAAFDAQVDALLRAAGCELLAFAGFMRILSEGFVKSWEGRMLNIHPSLLPSFPGLDPHGQAIAAG